MEAGGLLAVYRFSGLFFIVCRMQVCYKTVNVLVAHAELVVNNEVKTVE